MIIVQHFPMFFGNSPGLVECISSRIPGHGDTWPSCGRVVRQEGGPSLDQRLDKEDPTQAVPAPGPQG